MVNSRYPDAYGCAWVAARSVAWSTAAANLCILAYTINEWPDRGSALAAGIAGSSLAMLNDSWIIASKINAEFHFEPLSHARAVVHDLFALAVSLGGIVMIVFSRYTFGSDGLTARPVDDGGGTALTSQAEVAKEMEKHGTSLYRLLLLGVWTLTATVLWRFVFMVWGLIDCFGELRTTRHRVVREEIRQIP